MKRNKWLIEAERNGLIDRVVEGKEVYREKQHTFRVLPLAEELFERGDKVEIIWKSTKFYQDKNGKIHKKW